MWRKLSFNTLNRRTDNIQVRLATSEDARLISDYFHKNRAYLQPWEPLREESFYTETGWAKKLIALNELHLLEKSFYCLIIDYHSKAMLGTISFSNLSRFPFYCCSVGYSLDKEMQGKGIMRRALKLACDWMFEVQNMHRISASYMPENKKSAAVLKATGFEEVGYAKDYLLINGKWQDHCLTALINPNWQEKSRTV